MSQVDRELVRLAESVANRMKKNKAAARTITLKIRFGDFRTITRSVTLSSATDSGAEILGHLRQLFPGGSNDHGIRLLGVAMSNLKKEGAEQLMLDDENGQRGLALSQSVAKIKERFGTGAILPASLIEESARPIR